MPVAPSYYMRRNYGNYAQQYDELARRWSKFSDEKKEAYPLEEFLADTMEDMYGTSTDYAAIDNAYGIPNEEFRSIGTDDPSYDSPFGKGWMERGVHDVSMPGGGMAYELYNMDPQGPRRNTIRLEDDATPSGMYNSPMNPENWDRRDIGRTQFMGDRQKFEDDRRRESYRDARDYLGGDVAGATNAQRVMDRVRRRISGYRGR